MDFAQCVTGAWADAWRMTRRSPLFIAVMVAGFYFLDVERNHVVAAHAQASPTLAALGALWVVQVLLISIATVQMQRFVLLDEAPVSSHAFLGGPYWRYIAVSYGIKLAVIFGVAATLLACVIARPILHLPKPGNFSLAVTGMLILWLAVWLQARIGLIITQASIGRPLRWRAAWNDTRGNLRKIYGTLCVLAVTLVIAFMPVVVLEFGFAAVLGKGSLQAIMQLCRAVFLVWASMVSAACAAYIYRRFAAELI